jgi:hypothetical protein
MAVIRTNSEIMRANKHDKLVGEITKAFFDKAQKENLDPKHVQTAIKCVQHIFSKDPKKKDKKCTICGKD